MANTGSGSPQREALDIIWALLVGGLLITVAGAGLASAAWPGTEVVNDAPSPQHTGDAAFAHLCLGAAGIGAVILLAGVLAVAVKLGIQAAQPPVSSVQIIARDE